MLLALDSAGPPAEHDGMYPLDALLAANYSVPILWLSLFGIDGLVTWPGIEGPAFTGVVQPRGECIERSRTRLGDWSRRWPEVFDDMSGPWLSYLAGIERAYLAVWAEELSRMADNDGEWAAELRGYLSSLDDPGSAGFRKALAQSYLHPDGSQLEPAGDVGVVTAGYSWEGQAPWEEAEPGSILERVMRDGEARSAGSGMAALIRRLRR